MFPVFVGASLISAIGLLANVKTFSGQYAPTWQCARKVQNTLVELADGFPVVQEHLHHLPPAHRLRQRVFIGQIHMASGSWWNRETQ